MKIFRVENDLHNGPFTSVRAPSNSTKTDHYDATVTWYKESEAHNHNLNAFPSLFDDGILRQVHSFDQAALAIGCDSMKQLAYWFYSKAMLASLDVLGFAVAEYDVPDAYCFYGNSLTQVGFLFFGGWRDKYPCTTHPMASLIPYQFD